MRAAIILLLYLFFRGYAGGKEGRVSILHSAKKETVAVLLTRHKAC
jgi:hypothetical protein